jgi:V/A-type H+/Na+-transporting ATPase subunit C
MSSGGATGYAALNARVRAMYSTMLTQQELNGLYEAPDFLSLIGLLKRSEYGPYLEKTKDKDMGPRRTAFQIRGRLTDVFSSIIHMAPDHARPLLSQYFRYFEVNNLKAVFRGIVAGASWEKIRFVLFPLGKESHLPLQEMAEAVNVGAAVELLRGTLYYEPLSYAMTRYVAENNLFPLEVALDLHYWRELWKTVDQLPGGDRAPALKIVGTLVDTNNLMWAIRYHVYHRLSEEELINYTLPFGYRVSDRDIRSIAAGADIAQLVKRIYPDLVDMDTLLQEPRKGLPELEFQLKRQVVRQCTAAFIGTPFHIGIPLAYLELLQLEIQDLTVLMEAKSVKGSHNDFRMYLMMGQVQKSVS